MVVVGPMKQNSSASSLTGTLGILSIVKQWWGGVGWSGVGWGGGGTPRGIRTKEQIKKLKKWSFSY